MCNMTDPNKLQNDGSIPLLPVGSVRSIVAINPPLLPTGPARSSAMPPSLPSRGMPSNLRRRGLSIGLSKINGTPSVAVMSICRDENSSGERGSECITTVASCVPPRADANGDGDDNNLGTGRISLATIVDSQDETRDCRVLGVQYSSNNAPSFSSVCIATIPRKTFPPKDATTNNQLSSILLAIDIHGKVHSCPIKANNTESQCKERNHLLDMQECCFNIITMPVKPTPKRGRKAKSPKKTKHENIESSTMASPTLNMMNNLIARLECASSSTTNAGTTGLSQKSSSSRTLRKKSPRKNTPTKGKGQKRKISPAKNATSPTITVEPPEMDKLYLVASNLNHYTPSSHSPPVAMLLTRDPSHKTESTGNGQWKGQSWSKIPGLEDVNSTLTCILFASRPKCGPMTWNGIISAMGSNNAGADNDMPGGLNDKESDEGVILMGFRDGSLRASVVSTNASDGSLPNGTIDISKATTLLQLSGNESFLSLQLLPSLNCSDASSVPSSILVCVGALGTIVTLSSSSDESGKKSCAKTPNFTIARLLGPCGARWISMACIGYHFLDERKNFSSESSDLVPSIGLSFVGINDSRHTFLHHISLQGNQQSEKRMDDDLEYNVGCGQTCYRLPISPRIASSIHGFPVPMRSSHEHPLMHVPFTVSAPNGKAVVLRVSLPGTEVISQTLPPHNGSGSLLSALKGEGSFKMMDDIAYRVKRARHSKKTGHHLNGGRSKSKLQSLLRSLDSATVKQNKNERNQLLEPINRQSNHATHEIREVTRIAAFISKSPPKNIPMPSQCEINKLGSQNQGVLKCDFTAKKMPLQSQPAATWLHSIHFLQSCPHSLSPALRPESTKSMSTLCYRRTARGYSKPAIVVYGGTATSYNSDNGNEGLHDPLVHMIGTELYMNDFVPISVYASVSMVFTDHIKMTQKIHKNTWLKASKIMQLKHDNVRSQVPHLTGSAKHGCGDTYGSDEERCCLGASLPFDLGTKTNNTTLSTFDVLSYAFGNDSHQCAVDLGGNNTSRDIAEKHIFQRFQNWSAKSNHLDEYVMPLFKEQQWIRHHSRCSAVNGGTEDSKLYCCSSSVSCATTGCDTDTWFSDRKEHCVNLGIGPLAIVFLLNQDGTGSTGDVGFAVGSNVITPGESMAMLPLMRQAITRQSLEHYNQTQHVLRENNYLMLLELYRGQLSKKQTVKIAKYISRSSQELIADIDETRGDKCMPSNDLLTSSISLYETMRTVNFSLGLQ